MKSHIKTIGVIDKEGQVHAVDFFPGVNVVTGKSSTGKSALIEIFDYCFGSSQFTVPEGVITQRAAIYYVVISIQNSIIVLGRTEETGKAFLKEESDGTLFHNTKLLSKKYFDAKFFFPLKTFKGMLGRYFNLTITDVDEDLSEREFRPQNRKKATPSIRSFTSLMLQHQNLVANKHAIFYRFDEREKREQVIDHMKIFFGFADQEYFILSQRLNELRAKLKSHETQIPRETRQKEICKVRFENANRNYTAASGCTLDQTITINAIDNPSVALELLRSSEVKIVAISDEHQRLKNAIDRELAERTSDLRKGQQTLADIQASIAFAKSYDQIATHISHPNGAEITASQCPFCRSFHTNVESAANKLTDALGWLNEELCRSRYHLAAFEEDENRQRNEIVKLKALVQESNAKAISIHKQILELAKNKTQFELAIKAKMEMETILEEVLETKNLRLPEHIEKIKQTISQMEDELHKKYHVYGRMREAASTVHSNMKAISSGLEFEESYKPVDLEFSFDTFDLWNNKDNRKIFLRSMGSGANWLSSHVTLFLGLQRYFCQLGAACKIPTILFLDQPSQVYFPSILDTGDKFSPKELAEREGDRKRTADEDLEAVTNLYSQLVQHCQYTFQRTGIMPQIIVTDHADSLNIPGEISFESLVRARWRTRGFIE